ncbi:MAG: hypothetical protein HRF43_18550 [Phycisphaerae bacterium]|jgi:hypothetical protein
MLISRVVPELPLNGSRYAPLGAENMDERIFASRVRARRRWIVRTGSLLLVSGVLLALLVVWRRDTQTIAVLMRMTRGSAAGVQAHLDRTGLLPPALPGDEANNFIYASYADRFYAQHANRPVIIAATRSIGLLLRPNGRCVITLEGDKVRSEWMTDTAFSAAYKAQLHRAAQFEQERSSRPPQLP